MQMGVRKNGKSKKTKLSSNPQVRQPFSALSRMLLEPGPLFWTRSECKEYIKVWNAYRTSAHAAVTRRSAKPKISSGAFDLK